MIFEKTLEEVEVVKDLKPKALTMQLEEGREYNLKRIAKAYGIKVKKISKSKLIKIAIDNLVKDVEELPEEEAIEYIRSLYKEAEF